MSGTPLAVAFALVVAARAPAAPAQAAATWSPLRGLAGGETIAVVTPPVTEAAPATAGAVYAVGTQGVLWRSTNGGATWSLAGPLPDWHGEMGTMTVAANSATTAYLLSLDGLLWKTADGGTTWNRAAAGMQFSTIAESPSQPATLFAVTPAQLERSDDGGETFQTQLPAALPGGNSSVVIDPTTPEILYTLGRDGLYKSVDGGVQWQAVGHSALASGLAALAIDPFHHLTLYASTPYNSVTLIKSTDGGATWAPADHGLPAVNQVDLQFGATGVLYAFDVVEGIVFSSSDGAASWQQEGSVGEDIEQFAVDSGIPLRLYASLSFGDGVQASADGGHTWAAQTAGIAALSVRQLVTTPARPRAVYAETWLSDEPDAHTWRNRNGGSGAWSSLAQLPLENPTLALDARAGVLYATDLVNLEADQEMVWRSADDGGSWTQEAFAGYTLTDLTANPRVSGALWALGGTVSGGIATFLLHSTDGGSTWVSGAEAASSTPSALEISAGGIFLGPASAGTLYVLLPWGDVLISTDSGASLAPAQPPGPAVALAVASSPVGMLFAATTRPRPIWRSANGGATWAAASLGLPTGTHVVALALDPAVSTTLYAATDRGVWVSDDGAHTWQTLGQGLPAVKLLSIVALAGTPRTVIVGTDGAGAFSLDR